MFIKQKLNVHATELKKLFVPAALEIDQLHHTTVI